MNAQVHQKPQWLDRCNGYWDLVVARDNKEHMLGMVDVSIPQKARSFVRRADGTWKLADHDSLEQAQQEVEAHAQI